MCRRGDPLRHSRDASKAAAFAKQFGVARSTDNYDVLLQDNDIDVVYIATPFATHHAMTRKALLAGKHVLVEKPMAMYFPDRWDHPRRKDYR